MTRVYRLYTTSTSSGDNKTSFRISKDGVVTSVCASVTGLQGADLLGTQRFEISKQSASSFAVNDTPNSVLCHFCVGAHSVVSMCTVDNLLIAGLNWAVVNGDTIYLHELLNSTAPIAGLISIDIFVEEK